MGREYVARDESIRRVVEVESEVIAVNLPEILHELLVTLYALLGFVKLPTSLVAEELEEVQSGRA